MSDIDPLFTVVIQLKMWNDALGNKYGKGKKNMKLDIEVIKTL